MESLKKGTLIRIPESTVVVTEYGKLLEVRRGDLKGNQIKDKKIWPSQDAWLLDVGTTSKPVIGERKKIVKTSSIISLLKAWGLPLINKSGLILNKYVGAMIEYNNIRIKNIKEFLVNFSSDIVKEEIDSCTYRFTKKGDGIYVDTYSNEQYTFEQLSKKIYEEKSKQLTILYKNLYDLENNYFTLVSKDGTKQYYSSRSYKHLLPIYIQAVNLEAVQPISPLLYNIKTGLIGYRGKAGYSLEEVGLGSMVVNIYKGNLHSLELHQANVKL